MSEAAPDIKGALSEKLGPLPVGVWVLAVAGGLAVAVFVRRRSLDTPVEEDPGVQDITASGPGWGIGNAAGGGTSSASDTPVETRPTTNEEWKSAAMRRLIGMGGYDALVVERALTAYLTGQPLSLQYQSIVSEVLMRLGPPPIQPPPPVGTDEPKPTPPDPPPPEQPPQTPGNPIPPSPPPPPPQRIKSGHWTFVVKKGDNLTKIGKPYHVPGIEVWQFNVHPGQRSEADRQTFLRQGPNLIYPGQVVWVPYTRDKSKW